MFLSLLSKSWFRHVLNSLISFAIGFAVSDRVHKDPEPVVVEKVVQGKKETVTVEKVVTRIVKPDGTIIERQKDQQKDEHKITQQTEHKSAPAPMPEPKSKYSVDLRYEPSLDRQPSATDSEVIVGARLGDSNLWGTAGYDLKHKQASVGIRYEW